MDPFELVQKYGLDAVRYYLLREIPSLDDGDFSFSRMDEIYKSDLSNELGNLLMRITTLASKDGLDTSFIKSKTNLFAYKFGNAYAQEFAGFQFNTVLEDIWKKIKQLNKETDEFAPWKKAPEERKEFLVSMLDKLYEVGILLEPLLPDTAQKILYATYGILEDKRVIEKTAPAFPRI